MSENWFGVHASVGGLGLGQAGDNNSRGERDGFSWRNGGRHQQYKNGGNHYFLFISKINSFDIRGK